jgi:hypothetical protein
MAAGTFETLRSQLHEARQRLERGRRELLLAEERRKRLELQQAELRRTFGDDDQAAVAERLRLEAQLGAAAELVADLGRRVADAETRLDAGFGAFARVSDPREQLERLGDAYPVLLLPLRLETRFQRIDGPRGVQHQLWVRAYPDDCAVDAFEDVLSEIEVRNARRYWAQVWRAGEDEQLGRAAWRNLVAGHGSGRALWLVEQYRPRAGAGPPPRDEDTVVLVIATAAPLDATTAERAARFWEETWRAHGDAAALAAAYERLVEAVGSERAQLVLDEFRPFNLDDSPPPRRTRADARVTVATVAFEPDDETAVKRRSWARAPRAGVLPDRLVLLGYSGEGAPVQALGNPIPSPLVVGPDPRAAAADRLRREGDDVAVGAAMRWMVDFDEAVRVGMGFRVDLTPAQYAAGFDRLLVLGVRLSADADAGRRELEQLLSHHHHSRRGLGLLRQGTPTSNTDEGGSGYTSTADADASYELARRATGGTPPPAPPADGLDARDGQWLAHLLGVERSVLERLPGADHTDVAEARVMNLALFPATIGYFLDTMLAPALDDDAVEFARAFFTGFVSGRGLLSPIRIGRQPYGILPTTVYSRMSWWRAANVPGLPPYLPRLYEVLMRAHRVWRSLLGRVAHAGGPGDPHRTLLDIVGLHPASVDFDLRYAESLEQLVNTLAIQDPRLRFERLVGLFRQGTDVLRGHGYDPPRTPPRPEILDKYFFGRADPVNAENLIHELPLSETEALPGESDYLTWLAEAAAASFDRLRTQEGLEPRPTALLYLMLRHALMLGYHGTGVQLHAAADARTPALASQLRRESPFVHIAAEPPGRESRFELLYAPSGSIAGPGDRSVAEHITSLLPTSAATARLREQIAAVGRLRGLPTARLERAFVEHLDACSYRLDAWLRGLVQLQLTLMRSRPAQKGRERSATPAAWVAAAPATQPGPVSLGLYLGAFGWLEEVRRSSSAREPVELRDPDLAAAFQRPGDAPLRRDSGNAGYVHAPSPNQAVTAAVLRSGYGVNATRDDPGVFAVNLSSERVRRALAIVEGVRNGQSLGALLGYQFERGLHDRHGQAEVDRFIFGLRKAFPLVADRIRDTALTAADDEADAGAPIQAIEARNVLDGAALVDHVQTTGKRRYPFGKRWLPAATDPQREAIDAEVDRLLDTHDAVADVGIAEAVHQLAQGNADRTAATLDAFSGDLPPLPDVVETPRSGIGLTHRVGLHLRPGLPPDDTPVAGVEVTPRAVAEPAINHWLASLLPRPGDVAVVVEVTDRAGEARRERVTQAELGLQPIDLLYLLNVSADQAMTALDDLVAGHLRARERLRPDARVSIRYSQPVDGSVSLFELTALISELRALIAAARPLRVADAALPNEANPALQPLPDYHPGRLTRVRDRLTAASGPLRALRALAAELEPLVADAEGNRSALVAGVDRRLQRFVEAAAGLTLFGLPQSGFGFALEWERECYSALLDKVDELVARWGTRFDTFDSLLAAYDELPDDTDEDARFKRLTELEAQVTTMPTIPLPATAAEYRAVVLDRRAALAGKRDGFRVLVDAPPPTLSLLLAGIEAAGRGLDHYDLTPFDLTEDADAIVRFSEDLLLHARNLVQECDERVAAVGERLARYAEATTESEREDAFTGAAHALLGDDFAVVPEFTLSESQARELQNAHGARDALLAHLTGRLGVDFPVDDWLYGVARVRLALQRWEALTVLAEALTGRELDLHPLQLPHRDGDSWLALAYPPDLEIDSDKLLYTAHFAAAFDAGSPQCGLLLDEWTEVVPAVEETTGVGFHYHRPNAEPPQAMLLVTPPQFTGRWQWADLVDALHETLELAKLRAVEPDHVAGTEYARFLPATIAAVAFSPITILLNYGLVNGVYRHLERGGADG